MTRLEWNTIKVWKWRRTATAPGLDQIFYQNVLFVPQSIQGVFESGSHPQNHLFLDVSIDEQASWKSNQLSQTDAILFDNPRNNPTSSTIHRNGFLNYFHSFLRRLQKQTFPPRLCVSRGDLKIRNKKARSCILTYGPLYHGPSISPLLWGTDGREMISMVFQQCMKALSKGILPKIHSMFCRIHLFHFLYA